LVDSQQNVCYSKGVTRPSFFMHGSLDPEENVMQDELISKRKAIAVCNQGVVEQLYDVIAQLGWDCYDDVSVEIGGTAVYEIDGAGTKWAPVKGTRKYNKDAFIIIKNRDRNVTVSSQPFGEGEFKPAHPLIEK